MRLAQRRFAVGQIQPLQHRLRQALRHRSPHAFQQVEDHLALPARGQPAAAQRLVHRRNPAHLQQPRFGVVGRVGQDLKLRLDHLEVAARARWLDLAVDRDCLPGLEFAVQIWRVEPDALECVAALPHGQLKERHAPRPQQNRPAHLGDHAGHFARLQFVQTARILPVFVAKGKMVEQILRRLDVFGASISATCGPTPRTYITGVSRAGTIRMLSHSSVSRAGRDAEIAPQIVLSGASACNSFARKMIWCIASLSAIRPPAATGGCAHRRSSRSARHSRANGHRSKSYAPPGQDRQHAKLARLRPGRM